MESKRPPATFQFENRPYVLIVEARHYDDIADLQLKGAQAVLDRVGVDYDTITVPGALEIPATILYAIKSLDFDAVRRRFDGYIALGCIIKGGTNHNDLVANECFRGIQDTALHYSLAVGNGVITCNTKEQGLERADPTKHDRGGAAAEACLRMIELKHQFRLSPKRRWIAR